MNHLYINITGTLLSFILAILEREMNILTNISFIGNEHEEILPDLYLSDDTSSDDDSSGQEVLGKRRNKERRKLLVAFTIINNKIINKEISYYNKRIKIRQKKKLNLRRIKKRIAGWVIFKDYQCI